MGDGGFTGGAGGTPTASVSVYEDKIKNLIASRANKWAEAPEDLKIHDENGQISEEFLRSTQGPANSQKQVQKELSEKFSEHLHNSKTIKPKIDQSRFYFYPSRH